MLPTQRHRPLALLASFRSCPYSVNRLVLELNMREGECESYTKLSSIYNNQFNWNPCVWRFFSRSEKQEISRRRGCRVRHYFAYTRTSTRTDSDPIASTKKDYKKCIRASHFEHFLWCCGSKRQRLILKARLGISVLGKMQGYGIRIVGPKGRYVAFKPALAHASCVFSSLLALVKSVNLLQQN